MVAVRGAPSETDRVKVVVCWVLANLDISHRQKALIHYLSKARLSEFHGTQVMVIWNIRILERRQAAFSWAMPSVP